jgi:hypothetical protein
MKALAPPYSFARTGTSRTPVSIRTGTPSNVASIQRRSSAAPVITTCLPERVSDTARRRHSSRDQRLRRRRVPGWSTVYGACRPFAPLLFALIARWHSAGTGGCVASPASVAITRPNLCSSCSPSMCGTMRSSRNEKPAEPKPQRNRAPERARSGIELGTYERSSMAMS